jgi:serine protease
MQLSRRPARAAVRRGPHRRTEAPAMTTGLRTKTVQDEDWHIEFCDFSAAWALSPPRPQGKQEGDGVVVVHPDTGYTDHPEIKSSRYLSQKPVGRNFFRSIGYMRSPEVRNAEDDLTGESKSHGTKTASMLISGKGAPNSAEFPSYNAAKAIWGVAPKVQVIPYRVTDLVMLTDATTIALTEAILYATTKLNTQEVGVISISLGRSSLWGVEDESRMIDALKEARKKGIVVCAAAGQLLRTWLGPDMGTPAFPARDPNAICVAGCQPDKDYSAIPSGFLGSEVDITAPAFDVWIAKSVKGGPSGRQAQRCHMNT